MIIRLQQEEYERTFLSEYAQLSNKTKGRQRYEEECDIRTCYQRDRDRILHSKSFRRLKDKTQVFLLPKGDHYRTRLMHTLEVSQTARTIARALKLNEDLTEAIALGHDLGHTPFGHTGEAALTEVCSQPFIHSEQSVRIVEFIEKEGLGLNLSWEVRDGIRNHQSSGNPQTLEGQIVRLSDKVAYINSDIDDAIRAEIISEEDIPGEYRRILGMNSRLRYNTLIHDIIINSFDQKQIKMSEDVENAMKGLRQFMFENVYLSSEAKKEEGKAKELVKRLYCYYFDNFEKIPKHFDRLYELSKDKEKIVCDYISGMTDKYAIDEFNNLFIPKGWDKK